MCGIAGRVGAHAGSREVLKKMTDSLLHRGPDDEGFFVLPGVELGARRLSIIDVQGGHQPIITSNDEVAVAFNGEIYNFGELRKELLSRGCPLKTQGDTEVIAYLYLLDGIEFIHKLRGMFAISIWDTRSQTLLLIRDRMGEKPLLYSTKADGGIDFASEAKALLRVGAAREADLRAVDFVLAFGYAPPPMTGFSSIVALPPGHVLKWSARRVSIERYWKFDSSRKEAFTEESAKHAVHAALEDSVKMMMVSERPLGVFLSGGVDSTLVTALAAKNSMQKLKTFSVGFKDQRFDESKYAKSVSDHLGTDHHELMVDPDPLEMVEILTSTLDRPFADSSVILSFLLSEFARSEVVVALGGDGGDEAAGGYSRYLMLERRHAANVALRFFSPLSPVFGRLESQSSGKVFSKLEGALRPYPNKQARYRGMVSLVHDSERAKLWRGSIAGGKGSEGPGEWFDSIWQNASSLGARDRALAVDIETYLPEDLNFKTDIASMAHGLELRAPFQDYKFMELCGSISPELKFRYGTTKYLLKEIAKRYVPESVIDRKKMGFGFPRAGWMRNELSSRVSEVLLGPTSRNRGWFNQTEVIRLIDVHKGGVDKDRILWPLFVIELWAQKWLD
ncbi:MAG: asparagine synthase (glutamine-hydrolyzing) [Candidatus Nanopelagicaceae bacterium]